MKEKLTMGIMFRLRPSEKRNIEKACASLGMKPSTYVRTIVLRELAAVFPKDKGAADRLMEQVAEMAGQVVREMSRGAVQSKKVK